MWMQPGLTVKEADFSVLFSTVAAASIHVLSSRLLPLFLIHRSFLEALPLLVTTLLPYSLSRAWLGFVFCGTQHSPLSPSQLVISGLTLPVTIPVPVGCGHLVQDRSLSLQSALHRLLAMSKAVVVATTPGAAADSFQRIRPMKSLGHFCRWAGGSVGVRRVNFRRLLRHCDICPGPQPLSCPSHSI